MNVDANELDNVNIGDRLVNRFKNKIYMARITLKRTNCCHLAKYSLQRTDDFKALVSM